MRVIWSRIYFSRSCNSCTRPAIGTVTLLPCPVGVEVGTHAPERDNGQEGVNTGGISEDSDDDDPDDTRTAYQLALSEDGGSKRRRVTKKRSNKHRCRKCGHEYSSQHWKTCHKVERAESESSNEGRSLNEGRPQNKFVPSANDGEKVWEVYKVPEDLICVLFKHFNYEDTTKCGPRKRCSG